MNRYIPAGILLLPLLLLGACGQKTTPVGPQVAAPLNPAATASPGATPAETGDANADDPRSGLNTSRPDSQKDLKPLSDSR